MKTPHQSRNKLVGALSAFVTRLGVFPANVSVLGTFGFFSESPVLFGLSIIAFDALVKGFYRGFWMTYLGFACYPLLGWISRKRLSHQLLALPLASFCFFLLSNAGVWFYWYPHTVSGLVLCYSLAVPFYARTLAGDLLFGYAFVGYRVLKQRGVSLRSLVRESHLSFGL